MLAPCCSLYGSLDKYAGVPLAVGSYMLCLVNVGSYKVMFSLYCYLVFPFAGSVKILLVLTCFAF